METTTHRLWMKETVETTAGPGQNPPSPHPRPNSSAPMISFGVMLLVAGLEKEAAKNGSVLRNKKCVVPWIPIAPAITNAREGSQSLLSVRKPMTFGVCHP